MVTIKMDKGQGQTLRYSDATYVRHPRERGGPGATGTVLVALDARFRGHDDRGYQMLEANRDVALHLTIIGAGTEARGFKGGGREIPGCSWCGG
jgi:hypothetical protein